MNGNQLRDARAKLGAMWGLKRPLHMSEMGRALRLSGRDPGSSVRDWERGNGPTGPASVAVEMMLAGAMPPDPIGKVLAPGAVPFEMPERTDPVAEALPKCPHCGAGAFIELWPEEGKDGHIICCSNEDCVEQPSVMGPSLDEAIGKWIELAGETR